MKKRILILLGILIIGGGAAGVCWKTGIIGNHQQTSGDAVYVTKISDLTDQAYPTVMRALLNRRRPYRLNWKAAGRLRKLRSRQVIRSKKDNFFLNMI